jgi:hypothetical protein
MFMSPHVALPLAQRLVFNTLSVLLQALLYSPGGLQLHGACSGGSAAPGRRAGRRGARGATPTPFSNRKWLIQ